MADYDELTYFHLQGLFNGITGDTTGIYGDAGYEPDLFAVNMTATIVYGQPGPDGQIVVAPPELRITGANPPRTLLLLPVAAQVTSGVLQLPGQDLGVYGVDLVAVSPVLNMSKTLLCQVSFGPASIGGREFQFDPVTFVVPTVLPADYHPNVVQTVTILNNPDGGNYNLVYDSVPTLNLPFNSTRATLQTALNNIVDIAGAVTVAVAPGGIDGKGPYAVTFDTSKVYRPLRLGIMSNLTSTAHTFPKVRVTDQFQPVTVDLTTVTRWTPNAA